MPDKQTLAKQRISYNINETLAKASYKKYKPKDKDYFVRDIKLEGFRIRVSPSGKKTYGCYSRKGGVGRPVKNSIGDCELTDFEDAKARAKKVIQQALQVQ